MRFFIGSDIVYGPCLIGTMLFAENGLGLLRASNNRIQGWMALKEMLKPLKNEQDKPGLLVTEDCVGLIENLPAIQHDEKNPSDCATEPHMITHICDAARYFAVTRTLGAGSRNAGRNCRRSSAKDGKRNNCGYVD